MKTAKTVKTNNRLELEYYKKVQLVGIAIYRAFNKEININDFSDEKISRNDQIGNFNKKVKKIISTVPAISSTMTNLYYRYFNAQFQKNFIKESFDIDLKSYFGSDKKILFQITAKSEDYIKKYGEETASWLRSAVRENYILGGRASSLEQQIKERFSVTDNRAKLIARNESKSFIGAFNLKRGRDLGIDKGIWRTVMDERVRSSHRPLNGKVFYLDEGLKVDGDYIFPGEEINCRCYFDYILDN